MSAAPPERGRLGFEVTARCPHTSARCGVVHLRRGSFETPVFMPVGTLATVKSLTSADVDALGARIILANAYHLHLRPGEDIVAELSGLHRFMGFDGLVLTDSGGYQVFSLEDSVRCEEDGASFRSHLDGTEHRFTPESVVELQERLGADIIMPLDQPVAPTATPEQAVEATERSDRWAERGRRHHLRPGGRGDQALFGIVQGGFDEALRRASAARVTSVGFDGYAVGGLSVGEAKDVMFAILAATTPGLPPDRPRYLMGVGTPSDLVESVALGVDMFDCVLPTRLARNNAAYTSEGRKALRNAQYARSDAPLDPACACETCRRYPLGYLRHLCVSKEMLAARLLTYHNLHFYLRLMETVRAAVREGTLPALRERMRDLYGHEGAHKSGAEGDTET
jgi:queuine tRNA-ribosyltransferase